jgi:hypothetical protein
METTEWVIVIIVVLLIFLLIIPMIMYFYNRNSCCPPKPPPPPKCCPPCPSCDCPVCPPPPVAPAPYPSPAPVPVDVPIPPPPVDTTQAIDAGAADDPNACNKPWYVPGTGPIGSQNIQVFQTPCFTTNTKINVNVPSISGCADSGFGIVLAKEAVANTPSCMVYCDYSTDQIYYYTGTGANPNQNGTGSSVYTGLNAISLSGANQLTIVPSGSTISILMNGVHISDQTLPFSPIGVFGVWNSCAPDSYITLT